MASVLDLSSLLVKKGDGKAQPLARSVPFTLPGNTIKMKTFNPTLDPEVLLLAPEQQSKSN